MTQYENKCFEELRVEDYMAGNKGQQQQPQQTAAGGFGGFGTAAQPGENNCWARHEFLRLVLSSLILWIHDSVINSSVLCHTRRCRTFV